MAESVESNFILVRMNRLALELIPGASDDLHGCLVIESCWNKSHSRCV